MPERKFEKLTRRDALKALAVGTAAALAACAPPVVVATPTQEPTPLQPELPTQTPTPVENTPTPAAVENTPTPAVAEKEIPTQISDENCRNFLEDLGEPSFQVEGKPGFFVDNNGNKVGLNYYSEKSSDTFGPDSGFRLEVAPMLLDIVVKGSWQYEVYGALDKRGDPFCWVGGHSVDERNFPYLINYAVRRQHTPDPLLNPDFETLNGPDVLYGMAGRPVSLDIDLVADWVKPYDPAFSSRTSILEKISVRHSLKVNGSENMQPLRDAYGGKATDTWYIIRGAEELYKLSELGAEPPFIISQATFSTWTSE